MTITATHATDSSSSWVEDDLGFTIEEGKAFLAWNSPDLGFTVGIHEHAATDAYVAQTLAAVEARFPGNSVEDEYALMGVRHFEFTPDSAYVFDRGALVIAEPLDD